MAGASTLGGAPLTGRQTVAGTQARGSAARRGAQAGPGDVPTVRQEPAPNLSISPQQFGSQIGAGTQDLARGIGDIAEAADAFRSRMQKTENAAVSAEYESQTNLLKAQKFEELKNSATDSNDFLTQWQEASTQINAEVRENLSGRYFLNQEGSSKLDLIDINQGESYGLKAVAHENNARVGRARNVLNQFADDLVNQVEINGDIETALAKMRETVAGFDEAYTPEEEVALVQQVGKKLKAAQKNWGLRNLDVMSEGDPDSTEIVVDLINAGGEGEEELYNETGFVLSDEELKVVNAFDGKPLSPSETRRVGNQVNAVRGKQVKAAQDTMEADVVSVIGDVIDNGASGPLSATQKDGITGILGPDKGQDYIRAIEMFSDSGIQPDPTDTADKKVLNRVFDGYVGRDDFTRGDPEAHAKLVKMTERAQVIAPDAASLIDAMVVSGGVDSTIQAMQTAERLFALNPEMARRDLPKRTIEAMTFYRQHVETMPGEQLVKEFREFSDPTQQQIREEIRTEAKELTKEFNAESAADAVFDEGIFSSEPGLPVDSIRKRTFAREYKKEWEDAYVRSGGDVAQATAQAKERIKEVWAASAVNGGRLTKYAPELIMPAVDGSHEWMRDQLEEDVAAKLGVSVGTFQIRKAGFPGTDEVSEGLGVMPEENVDLPEVFIVADRQTVVDFNAKRSPTYQVMIQRGDGSGIAPLGTITFDPSKLQAQEQFNFEKERVRRIKMLQSIDRHNREIEEAGDMWSP